VTTPNNVKSVKLSVQSSKENKENIPPQGIKYEPKKRTFKEAQIEEVKTMVIDKRKKGAKG
jgi:hypothetical protein